MIIQTKLENMSRENKELLVEMGYEDAVVLENPDYDSAIIGVSESGRVIYDYGDIDSHD